MKSTRSCTLRYLTAVFTIILLLGKYAAVPCYAGGVWLYEIGTPDLGTATAGRSATALDASVAITNPAAMPYLDRPQLMMGFQALIINSEFSKDLSRYEGGDGGNAGGIMPAGSFSYAAPVNEHTWLGVGFGSYFGLGLDYDDNWSGRYYVQESSLITAGASVSLGTKITESFSIGAGIDVLVAKLLIKTAINNFPLRNSANDGELKVDATTTGIGANLGFFYTITPALRAGLTYRSPIKLDFDDAVSISNLGPILEKTLTASQLLGKELDVTITIPQAVSLGVEYDITKKWAVLGNFGWQNWSQFGELEVSISNTNISDAVIDLDYNDTWHFAIGIRGRIAPKWIWSTGAAYDTSPCSESNRSPALPLDRQLRYATGVQYEIDDDVTIGLAYQFLDAGKGKINKEGGPLTGPLKGEYSPNHIHYVAINVGWKF
ncbi:OmpP1/FadL family transporter [Halodesulfovibrio marinisediminis]|uniref:Long-chain fatty acid transport protein n=1 Tax=Halodesulfovibrio marinisediminis DSM 17456 TaxID=1121457 RepID=A0A1N6GPM1_9BACT|nr:outer membrane protein transport protein [Halodesulfovibrio marinisediminis]SIO09471.1 long-chain fatty acid transport protein [Halodesulfovibrio marinisediminis DSM 17456]